MTLASFGFRLVRPLLQVLDAERAHGVTIKLLKLMPPATASPQDSLLTVSAFGLHFANPLGIAAGFDKNAEVADATLAQGLGFVEVGTLTPRPQSGNPRPRLFRLAQDRAVINRMGFNNDGHAAAFTRLAARRRSVGPVGVNLGANKDSSDRIADYAAGIEAFSEVADYLVVNISSPNTPGLRDLQSRTELQSLLTRLNEVRAQRTKRPPMLLKIAPDLRDDELEDIVRCCGGGMVDGIIVSNTTITRPPLESRHAQEPGGLSGTPLFELSTRQLARLHLLTEGGIPLVGVGGIGDAETAWAKILAGATLLQLYTALIYRGPGLVAEILEGLSARLRREGSTLESVRGRDARTIAHQGLSGT